MAVVVVIVVGVVVLVQTSQMSVSDKVNESQISPQLSWHVLCLVRMQSLHGDHSPQLDGHSYGVVHSDGVQVSFGLQLGSTPSTSNSTIRTGLSQVPSHLVV